MGVGDSGRAKEQPSLIIESFQVAWAPMMWMWLVLI